MRTTMNTVSRHMLYQIQNRYSDLSKLQEELSTGKRLQRASDDPIDATNDIKLRSKLAQTSQYKSNIEDGIAFMGVADTAMSSMNTLMQRMRELAIEASSDTMTSNERVDIRAEVDQLTRQLVALANTNYKGDYVFGGAQSKIAPYQIQTSRGDSAQDYAQLSMSYYDATGQLRNAFDNTPITKILPGSFSLSVGGTHYVEGTDYTLDYVTGILTPINPALQVPNNPGTANYAQGAFKIDFDYLGSGKDIYGDPTTTQGEILREIEPGIAPAINITGDEVFKNVDTGTDTFEAIIKFTQNLTKADGNVIGQSINDIDNVFKNMLAAQAKNGGRVNLFNTTLDRNEEQFNQTSELQSNLEDADMADTVMKFSQTENVYNAALKAGATVIQQSLVNFL